MHTAFLTLERMTLQGIEKVQALEPFTGLRTLYLEGNGKAIAGSFTIK
jgi:hypothetical protein